MSNHLPTAHGQTPDAQECAGCALQGNRRDFLREATVVAAGLFLGLGLSPRRAEAMSIGFSSGRRTRRGTEVSYPIPATDGATIDKPNEVILVRLGANVYAFALSCPHQNTALKWLDDDKLFQCPKHKSKYQPDGTFVSGRATRNMDRLPIRSDDKNVFVTTDKTLESDKDPAGWAAAAAKV